MHRAALLLACACAVYAHQYSFPPNYIEPPGPRVFPLLPLKKNLARITVTQYPFDLKGIDGPFHSQPSPTVIRSSSPKSWIAPPYSQSLQAYDDGIAKISAHFNRQALFPGHEKDKDFYYNMMMHVVSLLSREVAQNGWEAYNLDYPNLVEKYIDGFYSNPQSAIELFHCAVLHPIHRAVQEVRQVIENHAVQYVCTAQPSSCDALIWAILHSSSSPEASQSEEVLLAAGNAASIFLDYYASTFENISGQTVFLYLLGSKEELRPLVAADAYVREKFNPRGEEPICNVPLRIN